MGQRIAIYFDGPGRLDAPFDEPLYLEAYHGFARYAADRGGRVLVVRGDAYQGDLTFKSGWEFRGDELAPVAGPITADLLYMKSLRPPFTVSAGSLVVNPLEFGEVTNDKWTMAQTFGELMPPTSLLTTDSWQQVIAKIPTDRVVLKPRRGSGGKGIVITPKATVNTSTVDLDGSYVAQPFVDSSAGIPGLCDGIHDLRILFFNAKPKLAYLRLPQTGKLLSNVSLGALVHIVQIAEVPGEILTMARAVDEHYQRYFPRHYSADFFMGPDRPYLVETNTQPGFPSLDDEGAQFQAEYYEYLWQLFDEAIKERTHATA